jgi:hypothetical protein
VRAGVPELGKTWYYIYMQNTNNRQIAEMIAKRADETYSFNRYTDLTDCAHVILDLGYTERETEFLLRNLVAWHGSLERKTNLRKPLDELIVLTYGPSKA